MAEVEIIGLPERIDPKVWALGEHYELDGRVYVIASAGPNQYVAVDIEKGELHYRNKQGQRHGITEGEWRYVSTPVLLGEPMDLLRQFGCRKLNVKKITVEVE